MTKMGSCTFVKHTLAGSVTKRTASGAASSPVTKPTICTRSVKSCNTPLEQQPQLEHSTNLMANERLDLLQNL